MKKYLIENNYQLSKISEKHNDVSKELVKFLRCMNESKYLDNATKKFLKVRKEHMNLLKILLIQTLGAVEEKIRLSLSLLPRKEIKLKYLIQLKNILIQKNFAVIYILFSIVKTSMHFKKKHIQEEIFQWQFLLLNKPFTSRAK